MIALDPAGRPRTGGPFDNGNLTGSGIHGNWWGIAIDSQDRVWLSNFTGSETHEFYSANFKGGYSASLFNADGTAVCRASSPSTELISRPDRSGARQQATPLTPADKRGARDAHFWPSRTNPGCLELSDHKARSARMGTDDPVFPSRWARRRRRPVNGDLRQGG